MKNEYVTLVNEAVSRDEQLGIIFYKDKEHIDNFMNFIMSNVKDIDGFGANFIHLNNDSIHTLKIVGNELKIYLKNDMGYVIFPLNELERVEVHKHNSIVLRTRTKHGQSRHLGFYFKDDYEIPSFEGETQEVSPETEG
jgi:hypothetical protein